LIAHALQLAPVKPVSHVQPPVEVGMPCPLQVPARLN
jgi:hypothetical protein